MFTRIAVTVSLIAVVLSLGCGGGSNPTPPPVTVTPSKLLYVVNSADATISAFIIGSSGALTPVQGSPFPSGATAPLALAATSSGLLYVGSSDSVNIRRFQIDSQTGVLSNGLSLPSSIRSAPAWTNALNVLPCGPILYAFGAAYASPPGTPAAKVGWGMTAYQLNADGSVSAGGWVGFGTNEPDPIVSNVAADPGCQYFFHATTGSNTVTESMYDAANHHEQGFIPAAVGTAPVAVALAGMKYLYVVNSGSNDVTAYAIDPPNGGFTPVSVLPFAAGLQPSAILVVQNWVYVTNSGSNDVSAYTWNSTTGVLTPVPGSPFPVGTSPSGLVSAYTDLSSSPSGQLLYVSNQGSNNVSAFIIRTDGSLQPVAGSPFATGNAPRGLTFAVGPQ